MGIFIYSHDIKALDYARLLPDNRTCNADILERQITTAKTALRSPPLSVDREAEAITRLDCEKTCAGFVEYFLGFIEKTVFYNSKTHGIKKNF